MKRTLPLALAASAAFLMSTGWTRATDQSLYYDLGTVIGSEASCGLTYDQDAIRAFIEKHVSPGDMEFIGDLDMRVSNVESEIEHMPVSQKTAHCTQVTRAAKVYGFVK